jgi:hypothetical protein
LTKQDSSGHRTFQYLIVIVSSSALWKALHKADYAKHRIMKIRQEKGTAKAEVMRHGARSSFP